MAGAFSGHLLDAFNSPTAQPNTPTSTIITSGAMSFDARAHGSILPHAPFGFTSLSEDSNTSKQIATLQAKLNKKLGPEYISQRPGPGGGPKLTYAEGWKIINLANEVFGFNGWSSSIVSVTTDFVDHNEESKKFNVGVTAIVRVTLRDGTYHEDLGYGMLENGKSKGAALDKCKKEAITDALKRTLRNFGNLLGNCLYDKSYAQEVVKIKVPPAKFDKNDLYRRPEFQERIPDTPAPAPNGQASTIRHDEPRIKLDHEGNQPETPITYVPRHLRQGMAAAAQQARAHTPARAPPVGTIESPANRGPPPIDDAPKANGLATPVQTPARGQRPPPPQAPPPRVVATSPLARMTSAPERSVSFAEPVSMPARAGSADAADQTMQHNDQATGLADDEYEDAFPLSTQDGAFLATVDLGEGDLGRPIDFDEGMGGVSIMDASEIEPELDSAERSPVVLPQPQPRVRDRTGSGSSAGSSSSGLAKTNMQAEPAARLSLSTSVNAHPNASTSGGQPRPRDGPSDIASASASTSSARAEAPAHEAQPPRPTMTSMGVSHFPSGMKPPLQHTPRPVVPACARTTSSTLRSTRVPDALKRKADVMQAGSSSGSSTRPPMQGMGLAQRQQQHQNQQNASANEGHDPTKRFKR
ncbi:hypothetical protein JVT61DRAFT_15384 [Boletus reticuloceps]|uniref:Uncharacterized protein n=1 Tax=Boletus reticuloceps TaxID=495285 RepID=A0A8I3ABP2_9AGAM|nr:hypothetical protein JVT61DRAFT_15384 [Boletus reticuloceps]